MLNGISTVKLFSRCLDKVNPHSKNVSFSGNWNDGIPVLLLELVSQSKTA